MLKRTIGVVTALFIVGAPMAYAQGASGAGNVHYNGRLIPTEFKILTDTRVGVVKVALQLTPEQQQYWQPVEDAIRARSEARYRRLSAFEERMGQWREVDPVQLYRERADALAERASGLKRLADAWQPLYQSLTLEQKMWLRVVTVRTIEGGGRPWRAAAWTCTTRTSPSSDPRARRAGAGRACAGSPGLPHPWHGGLPWPA